MEVDIDESGREPGAMEIDRKGVGRRRIRAEARDDATAFEQERSGLGGPRSLGIEQLGAVKPEPRHEARSLSEARPRGSALKRSPWRSDPAGVPNAPQPVTTADTAEELIVLDHKLKQLRFEYEQYFVGSRPREPVLTRGDVNKLVAKYSNVGIQNTALRFKFNNLCSRFFAMRRQWDETLRKIEAGTYERHVFKAKLHERERGVAPEPLPSAAAGNETTDGGTDLFEAYSKAKAACGEDVAALSREKLDQLVAKQREAIRAKTGCEEVRFRVVVENGKAKLKATPIKKTAAS